ncbi:hypothetical protein HMPREF0880_00387 [Yokenella regensburgei ATCC 43003]|nr:hypothetical protein HMPREF0880_00387 [Yokenella regensburgei ATCC 43003]
MKSMRSSKTLQKAIADITIWRKGGQREPHKPLLLFHLLPGISRATVACLTTVQRFATN